jgi:hypothetical protein
VVDDEDGVDSCGDGGDDDEAAVAAPKTTTTMITVMIMMMTIYLHSDYLSCTAPSFHDGTAKFRFLSFLFHGEDKISEA